MFRRGSDARRAVVALAVLLAVATGCASSNDTSEAPTRPSPRQFCNARARREVSTSLGVRMLQTPAAHVDGGRYACTYRFADGAIGVSVTRFPSADAARARLEAIASAQGRRPEPPMLGEELEAFVTTRGSMVVRKDRNVLEIDVDGLPARFGRPAQARSVIALAVAVTTIGHWIPG